ncbi:MAG: hypothetical protein LC118_02480 [Dehalococcoidia bacterium]|nr:hypothetical protein [Dehalococcoidia bacterium]
MENGLQQIAELPRVGGAFVCDNRGDVIASSSPAVLATVTMNTIGREVGHALGALETAKVATNRIEFEFDTWRLLAVDMGEAALFVVMEPGADLPVVRMTTEVVLAGWKRDSRAQKQIARHRAARNEALARATFDDVSLRSLRVIQSHG